MRALFMFDDARSRHPLVIAWFKDHQGLLGEISMRWFDVIRHFPI